jgi:hypothetical protein
MALAYKCDICGRFFEEKPTTIAVIGGRVVSRTRSDRKNILVSDNACDFLVEICQDCRASFVFWKDSRNPSRITVFEDKEDGVVSKS